MPTSPDFFGISDRVKQLSPPPGFEAVHTDGMSWARQGTNWADTTRIAPGDWNNLIGNLRGIGLMPDIVSNDFDPAGPYVLREALFNFVLKQVDVMLVPYMAEINAALALKAPLASPALTGNPTAPTQAIDNNSTRIATTAFVKALMDLIYGDTVSSDLDSFSDIATALALKAPLASPALTGNPTAPTQATSDNSTRLATTAYVKALIDLIYGGAVSSDMDTFADIEAKVATKADLSMFEAGDWTPTFEGSTVPGSISYNSQVGKYVAVGRMVFVTFDVQAGAVFSTLPTGNLLIAGLPFSPDIGDSAAGAASISRAAAFVNLPANFSGWGARRANGVSKLQVLVFLSTTGASSVVDANILTENTRFTGSFVYRRA